MIFFPGEKKLLERLIVSCSTEQNTRDRALVLLLTSQLVGEKAIWKKTALSLAQICRIRVMFYEGGVGYALSGSLNKVFSSEVGDETEIGIRSPNQERFWERREWGGYTKKEARRVSAKLGYRIPNQKKAFQISGRSNSFNPRAVRRAFLD